MTMPVHESSFWRKARSAFHLVADDPEAIRKPHLEQFKVPLYDCNVSLHYRRSTSCYNQYCDTATLSSLKWSLVMLAVVLSYVAISFADGVVLAVRVNS